MKELRNGTNYDVLFVRRTFYTAFGNDLTFIFNDQSLRLRVVTQNAIIFFCLQNLMRKMHCVSFCSVLFFFFQKNFRHILWKENVHCILKHSKIKTKVDTNSCQFETIWIIVRVINQFSSRKWMILFRKMFIHFPNIESIAISTVNLN